MELYKKFSKVHFIDANRGVNEVYADTKKAMMPKVFFNIGPKCSGKTTLGTALAERTNMTMLNFNDFLKDNNLNGKDD